MLHYTNINTAKVSNHNHIRQTGVSFPTGYFLPLQSQNILILVLRGLYGRVTVRKLSCHSQGGQSYRFHSHTAERRLLASPCLSVCLLVFNSVKATRKVFDEFWCHLLVKSGTDVRKHIRFCKILTPCVNVQAFAIFEVPKGLEGAETARV